jgi:hypothetical protein
MELAAKWEREAYEAESMAKNTDYNQLEQKMLRQQANVRRGCAQELKLEFATVRRG